MPTRRITVADTDADPAAYPVAFAVEVVSDTATAGDRACSQVTVTNRGTDTIEFHTGFPGVFDGLASEETAPGLFLYPTGNTPPRAVSQGDHQPTGYPLPAYLQRHELAPDTSESVTLDVLNKDPTEPWGRLPKGTFTFQADYDIPVANTEETFDWGFSLTVE